MAGEPLQRDIYGHAGKHIHPITGEHHGAFDPSACPIGGRVYQPVKQCCGKYPSRKIYKTSAEGADGHRQCCDLEDGDNDGSTRGKTFLKDSQTCCGSLGGVLEGVSMPCNITRKKRRVNEKSRKKRSTITQKRR